MSNGIFTRSLLALSLAVPALALSACGDGSSDGTGSGGSNTASSSGGSSNTTPKTEATGTAGTSSVGTGSDTGTTTTTTTGTSETSNTSTPSDTNTDTSNTSGDTPTKNLLELAEGSADHKIFVELVKIAELQTVLNGTDAYTVFAPTDAAFSKVDKAKLDALKADKAKLKQVLLGHATGGKVKAADIAKGKSKIEAKNEAKLSLVIDSDGTTVTVNGAKVVKADMLATNGVIHSVDAVILAPEQNIREVVAENDKLSKLKEALKDDKVKELFTGKGPFTFFAPSDAAFKKFTDGGGTVPTGDELKALLEFHAVAVEKFGFELKDKESLDTLLKDKKQTISVTATEVKYGDAKVTGADIRTANGVIHIIDTVLPVPTF